MLKQLVIQNIAIAEHVEAEFDSGLNVITGETGAGKSLLVDALALLRGHRVDLSLIRSGCESAQVSATFEVKKNKRVISLLEELGIDSQDGEVVLRKTISKNGKHKAFVNDTPLHGRSMQVVASELIDISSQFENQRLLDEGSHTVYLDQFVEASLSAELLSEKYRATQDVIQELFQIENQIEQKKRDSQLYQYELNEISEANPTQNEWDEVQAILNIGNKAVQAQKICADILMSLSESDDSCLAQLKFCQKNVERLSKLSNAVTLPLSLSDVSEAQASVENLVFAVHRASTLFDIDEEKLAFSQERSETYNKLLSKFGPTLDDVLAYQAKCEQYLQQKDHLEERLGHLSQNALTLIRESIEIGSKLSKRRRDGLTKLSKAIEGELTELGMPKTRFVASLESNEKTKEQPLPNSLTSLLEESERANFTKLTKLGFERAHFLLSANVGMDPQPIEKVASGGELSRVMLAIKNVLFNDTALSVFVFDEIDTGVGGAVAAKIGRKLAEFCTGRQSICITHLAQVACYAKTHFIAEKKVASNKTLAQLKKANEQERLNELAKMISGEKVSPESLAQAKRLKSEAVQTKK